MNKAKRNKIIYWVLTILVLAPTAGSGILELFTSGPEAVIQTFHTLGYPLYLLKILGLSKILGAIAILTGRFPKLKEWAYAGFTFNFLGATASHLLAGDPAHAPIPFIFFLLLMGSYYFWKKTAQGF
ncbi:MAG TPA: DoxX family protein [bacterium]